MTLPRIEIRAPERVRLSIPRLVSHLVASIGLVPANWLLAASRGVPGLRAGARSALLGAKLILAPRAARSLEHAARLILMPMDSTRFFELDFVERASRQLRASRYLDVSSPRLVPLLFAIDRPEANLDLLNPDPSDLAETRELVEAAGIGARCRLHSSLVADAPFQPATFDLITCVSVLEHITNDTEALERIWTWLAPGGLLVLTVPCMARACEQFLNEDEYGLLDADPRGFFFLQRFYDSKLLEERVFSVVGQPSSSAIYGEKIAGSFARNAEQKRKLGRGYPFWREPYMMAREYRTFEALEQLPGEGVIGLTFVKP